MNELAGAVELTRFVVRRDRVRMAVWVIGIAVLMTLTAAGVKALYPTQADLDEAAAVTKGNAALIAFNGPVQGLNTIGGQVAFQGGTNGLVVVALMSVLMIGRLTRAEEEAGRVELLRALPIGSQAPSAAALIAVGAMDVAVGALVTVAMIGEGLPVAGSINLGLSFTLAGLAFAGITLVAAQITENARVVAGSTGSLIGVSFVVRAMGDIGDGTLSWFSPIGWAQKARPFAGERWWPFLLLVAALGAAVAAARALAERRDLGGGLVPPRPGRPVAARSLGQPLGLAVRLQRGSVIGWGLGVLATGIVFGSLAPSIDEFIGNNRALADILARAGGASLTDSYLATSFRLLALVATGFAVQAALRLRAEETSLRAEAVLATPVSRWRWVASHLVVAFAGSVALLTVAGLGVGATYATLSGDTGVAARLLGAALVYAPAMWLAIGLAVAVVGITPQAAVASWAALAAFLVVGVLGELLSLPHWARGISPFEHVPKVPAASFNAVPLLVITAIAVILTASGVAGLRRRDIG